MTVHDLLNTTLDVGTARHIARLALDRQRPGERFGLGDLKSGYRGASAFVFCAASPEERLTVKVFGPVAADRGRAQYVRQQIVTAALPGIAPEVLFYDPELRVLGMSYADGSSLAALWPAISPDAQLGWLEQAGRWLARLHGSTMVPHPFRPRGPLDWLAAVVRGHRAGTRTVHEPGLFERHLAELEAFFPLVRAQPSQRAILHRDLHLSNLLATDRGIVGLDFENERADEPLPPQNPLLIDAMARSDPEQDAHIPAAALARGYGPLVAQGDVMIFVQRLVALGVWASMPVHPSQHHVARYVAARQIADLRVPLFQA